MFVCFRGSKALKNRKHGFSIDFCTTFHSLNAVLKSEKGYNFQGVKFLNSSFLHRIYFHNGQPRIFQKRACHTTSVKLETKKAVMAKLALCNKYVILNEYLFTIVSLLHSITLLSIRKCKKIKSSDSLTHYCSASG